jgi:hypothetical protein
MSERKNAAGRTVVKNSVTGHIVASICKNPLIDDVISLQRNVARIHWKMLLKDRRQDCENQIWLLYKIPFCTTGRIFLT